jgi:hypothetical protein
VPQTEAAETGPLIEPAVPEPQTETAPLEPEPETGPEAVAPEPAAPAQVIVDVPEPAKETRKAEPVTAGEAPPSVAEIDEKPVVNWTDAPNPDIAAKYNMLHRPAYVLKGGQRVVADRGDPENKKDANGWLTGTGVSQYPYFGTTEADMGAIGGVGMRMYYFVIKSLAILFLVFGCMSIPAITAYGKGTMYDSPSAARYADVLGCRQSLGALQFAGREVEDGTAGDLWIASFTNMGVALVLIGFTLWVNKAMREINDEVDADTITMSDYTVCVMPLHDKEWTAFQVSASNTKTKQKQALVDAVEKALESQISGSQIAEINKKEAIWVAWNESDQIHLWTKKSDLLMQLESSLNTGVEVKGVQLHPM